MATDDHRPSFTMCAEDRAWIEDALARRRRRMEDSGMCVVTQTVERVARELREQATGIEAQAGAIERIKVAEDGGAWSMHETMEHGRTLRARAKVLRADAKLLDGKE